VSSGRVDRNSPAQAGHAGDAPPGRGDRRDAAAIREAVLAVIASIAPEADVRQLRPDQPLRQQVDLDSMDWQNLFAALEQRLAIEIPPAEQGRLATLDALVDDLAKRPPARPRSPPRPTAAATAPLPTTQHRINDAVVTLRPMRADDLALEAEFVRRLSSDARYKKFMATVGELPKGKLRYLTDVDQVGHVALVATVQRDGRETPVGVVRYVLDATGSSCEFAVAVDDAWQGSGLAGLLMRTLMDVARARGLKTMEGLVLAINARMLKFTRQLGFSQAHEPDDYSTVRVVRPL
jgi:GNAT superfamily N-acetyltransferase/acyl carrier protein